MSDQIIYTDRYLATGTPYPHPDTVCEGQCEGMGCYPQSEDDPNATEYEREAVSEAKARNGASEDGYYFIRCPDCNGTGKRPTAQEGA